MQLSEARGTPRCQKAPVLKDEGGDTMCESRGKGEGGKRISNKTKKNGSKGDLSTDGKGGGENYHISEVGRKLSIVSWGKEKTLSSPKEEKSGKGPSQRRLWTPSQSISFHHPQEGFHLI